MTRLKPLADRGMSEILAENVPSDRIRIECFLDMRYRGQSYELIIPFSDTVYADFHHQHQQQYGYANESAPLEVVNLRVRAIGRGDPPPLSPHPFQGPDPAPALLDSRPVVFSEGTLETSFYHGKLLQHGNRIQGPAVIVRSDTTILLGSTDRAEVDQYENLRIQVGK